MVTNGSTFVQGSYVMVVGMVIVFAALALVMLATMILERIFRPKPETLPKEKASTTLPNALTAQLSTEATAEREIVAAIAIALALRLQEAEKAATPIPVRVLSLRDEPSLWATSGKLR